MKNQINSLRILIFALLAAVMAACASIGRPEGGPRDEVPPVYISSKPAPGSTNFKQNKIEILFDENIKIEDALNKVVVSPAQPTPPTITALGKRLIVEFRDTLLDSTTYTVDFSDAVRDLNEGNILDGFAFDFSTGSSIDSLQISGMVLEASNLEPAQGMLVGVYSNLADSAISTLRLERIAKTNQFGQFTVRNLKPGTYRVYALNDINRDFHWDRSENVAFYDTTITPTSSPGERIDTLTNSLGEDSIVTRKVTNFAPRDILLTWFNENYKSQYLKNHKRLDNKRLRIEMAAPADSFPSLTIINGRNAGRTDKEWAVLNPTLGRDTLEYWISDSAIIKQDSLLIATRYLRTDTLDQLSWTTDTLKFIYKAPKAKKKKEKDEEKNDTTSTPKLNFLEFKAISPTSQDLHLPMKFEASQPLDTIMPEGVHLEILKDSTWTAVTPMPKLERNTAEGIMRYDLHHKWEGGEKYRLIIDSTAVKGIYNEWNRPIKHEVTVKTNEEYANVYFRIADPGKPVIVELLNSSDKPVYSTRLDGDVAEFKFVNPAVYYARAYIDANNNGEWDTGNLKNKVQPEEVYYYPKKINVRRNWDIEQSWNLYELPLDVQKPREILKNKPVTKEKDPNATEEEEEEDEFYDDPFGGQQFDNSNSSKIRNPRLRRGNSNDMIRR